MLIHCEFQEGNFLPLVPSWSQLRLKILRLVFRLMSDENKSTSVSVSDGHWNRCGFEMNIFLIFYVT